MNSVHKYRKNKAWNETHINEYDPKVNCCILNPPAHMMEMAERYHTLLMFINPINPTLQDASIPFSNFHTRDHRHVQFWSRSIPEACMECNKKHNKLISSKRVYFTQNTIIFMQCLETLTPISVYCAKLLAISLMYRIDGMTIPHGSITFTEQKKCFPPAFLCFDPCVGRSLL